MPIPVPMVLSVPVLLVLAAFLVRPAGAGETDPAPVPRSPTETEACLAAQTDCVNLCAERHGERENARLGCEIRCTLERLACEVEAGVKTARPWLEDQVRRLEEFMEGLGLEPPEEPIPEDERPSQDGYEDEDGPKDI